MRRAVLFVIALAACRPASSAPPTMPDTLVFTGMCDASGGVALSATLMVVANDEDNVLRVFDVRTGGAPIATLDVSAGLALPIKKKGAPETDLEASTRLGDQLVWMTSHGRNKNAKEKPERLRLFATTAPVDGLGLAISGTPYELLLDDLITAPTLARFDLATAATLAPKAPGGLNLEGLTSRPDGALLLGLRNPIPDGRALVVPLENPLEVLAGTARARLGQPVQLDLGGLGLRAMSRLPDGYLLVAGTSASGGTSRLFRWDGVGAPVATGVRLDDVNPEAIVTFADTPRVLLLSDDGELAIGGVACKDLPDASRRRFAARWVTP